MANGNKNGQTPEDFLLAPPEEDEDALLAPPDQDDPEESLLAPPEDDPERELPPTRPLEGLPRAPAEGTDVRFNMRRNQRIRQMQDQVDRLTSEAARVRQRAESQPVEIPGVGGTLRVPDPEIKKEEQRIIGQRKEIEDRISAAEQQIFDELDTGQSAASSAFSSFIRPIAEGISSDLLKFSGVSSSLMSRSPGLQRAFRLFPDPDTGRPEDDPRESPTYKAGEEVAEAIRETFPENPKFQRDFALRTLPSAFGSGIEYAGLSALTGGGASAVLGAAHLSTKEFENALDRTGDLDKAFDTFLLNLPIGASEIIPIARMFRRLDRGTGGALKRSLRDIAKRQAGAAIPESLEEMTQEGLQQYFSNLTARQIYDETRDLFEGMAEGAGAGAIVGAFLGSAGQALSDVAERSEGRKAEETRRAESFVNEMQREFVGADRARQRRQQAQELADETAEEGEVPIREEIQFTYDPTAPVDQQIRELADERTRMRRQLEQSEEGSQEEADIEVALEQVDTLIESKREELSPTRPADEGQEQDEGPLGTPVSEENVRGEPMYRNGLTVAARNPDGTTFVGGPAHASLIDQFDEELDIGLAEMGFMDQQGRFLSRAEASEFINQRSGRPAEQQPEQQPETPQQTQATRLQKASTATEADLQDMARAGIPDAAIEQAQQPDILQTPEGQLPETGTPIEVEVFRGRGREDIGEVYAEGAEGPILGDANYFAINENEARQFGDDVRRQTVRLENPLVINNDQQLARWMMGDENANIPAENEQRSALREEFRNRVEQAGYDGVIVNVPRLHDVNPRGESAEALSDIFGITQVVDFSRPEGAQETAFDRAKQRRGLRSSVLFAEDIMDVTPTSADVLGGQYTVRRDQTGFEVINNETGKEVGRQSSNWNPAVAEFIVRDIANGSDFVADETIANEQEYLEIVLERSTNPVEIAQAYNLARTLEQQQAEAGATETLQSFFEEGGKIRPADFREYSDFTFISDSPRLRFFTDRTATPLDEQAAILSRQAGREIEPGDIIDYLLDDYINQGTEQTMAGRLAEQFENVTGATLTRGLADQIETAQLNEFVNEEGSIVSEVEFFLEDFVGEDGSINYRRLWNEALSEDQQKDFFTGGFPLTLSEDEYQQLKQEVQDAIENQTTQEEEAVRPEPPAQPGTAQPSPQQPAEGERITPSARRVLDEIDRAEAPGDQINLSRNRIVAAAAENGIPTEGRPVLDILQDLRNKALGVPESIDQGPTVPPSPPFDDGDPPYIGPDDAAGDLFEGGFDDISDSVFDRIRFNLQDRLIDLKRYQEAAVEQRGSLDDVMDAYLQEELFTGRVEDAIDEFIDQHEDVILDKIDEMGWSLEQAETYLMARHAPERNRQIARINPDLPDGGSGMSTREANEILDQVHESEEAADARELGQLWDEMTAFQRELLVDSGLARPEVIENWNSVYDHYISLKGDREGVDTPNTGKGFDTGGRFQRATGRTTIAENAISNTLAQIRGDIVRAEKAVVGRALMRFIRENPNPDIWTVDRVELRPTINKKTGLVQYRPDPRYTLRDNVLNIKINGFDHHVTFHSDRGKKLAAALKNLGSQNSGVLVKGLYSLNRYLALMNTGLNPEFIVSNFLRDIQTAGINLGSTEADALRSRILKDVFKARRGMIDHLSGKETNDAWRREAELFIKTGGKTGWIDAYKEVDKFRGELENRLKRLGRGKGDPRELARSFFNWIQRHNEAVENMVRLSAFYHSRRAGLSTQRAASLAKNLTVNFNRRGMYGPALNAAYLFYGATVQGGMRIFQAVKSPKVRKMVGGAFTGLVFLDMINRISGGEDDDGIPYYDKIPQWIKERNTIFMLPFTEGEHFMIPSPYGYNVINVAAMEFSKAASSFYNWLGGPGGQQVAPVEYSPGQGAVNITTAFIDAFNPVGSGGSFLQMIANTALDPFVQTSQNIDWTGRPIKPPTNVFDLTPLPESEQYFDSAPEWAKWAAREINDLTGGTPVEPGALSISPEYMEHWYRFLTGGVGNFVDEGSDAIVKTIRGEQLEPYRIPFAGKVWGSINKYNTQNKYIEYRKKIEYAWENLEYARETDDEELAREIETDRELWLDHKKFLDQVQRDIQSLKEDKKVIQNDEGLTRKEKQKQIDEIEQDILSLQKELVGSITSELKKE